MTTLFIEFIFIALGLGLGLSFNNQSLFRVATFFGICVPLISVMLLVSATTSRTRGSARTHSRKLV